MTNEDYPNQEESTPHYSGPYEHDPRDPVPFSEAMEEAVGMIEQAARENEPVAGARNRLRELLDPKTRGDREVSDEELGAALLDLGRALGGDKDEGTPRPE
jgi:hypothetical protein